jgi:putative transport protein
MNILELLQGLADLAAEEPLLLLALLLAVGGAIGSFKIKGFSLGPAAVLFTALAFSAFDDRLRIAREVGIFGLAIFAFVIGVGSGPSFFNSLRSGGRALLAVVLTLLIAAGVTVGAGLALGIDGPMLSGLYAGALTNTPALAAATQMWDSDIPTIGYSVTYLFGVLGMLLAALLAAKTKPTKATNPADLEDPTKPQVASLTVRIENASTATLGEISATYNGKLVFSRVMRGDSPGHAGKVDLATDDWVLQPGDIITVVGDPAAIDEWVIKAGHPSTVALTYDRSALDFRRIAVSNEAVAGVPLAELRLIRKFGAVATRVRRGDIDLLATDDLELQLGDRVRVVASPQRLKEVARFFGDSEKAAQQFSLTNFGLGLAIGVLVGLIEIPIPGGGTFALGMAGGPLVVGLILGKFQRTGSLLWTLPMSASNTLNHLGMMLFLAYAGSNSGAALAEAIVQPLGWKLFVVGLAITFSAAFGHLFIGRYLGGLHGAKLAGAIAGAQTQPAVLAYANERSQDDPRVNLGYALAYPVGMIVKVVVAPLLGRF